jgi:hypothetical protein
VDYRIIIGLSDYQGAATFPMNASTTHSMAVFGPNGTLWGGVTRSNGTVVVTSQTSARIKGTFDVTMSADPSSPTTTGSVRAVGNFDVGIP